MYDLDVSSMFRTTDANPHSGVINCKLKDTVMQIKKAQINDRLRVSNVS